MATAQRTTARGRHESKENRAGRRPEIIHGEGQEGFKT